MRHMAIGVSVIVAVAILWSAAPSAAATMRYTSPTGSRSSKCLINDRCTNQRALALVAAGDTISMAAGTMAAPLIYQGPSGVLVLPAGKSGTSTAPITVLCEVPGGCLIDGQFISGQGPIRLVGNNWWVFQDFNARNGNIAVIEFVFNQPPSNDNKFFRMVTWDARLDANTQTLMINSGSRNLFEDLAAFGTARKLITPYAGSNYNICRRCWFRWDGNTWGGGTAATLMYNAVGMIYENILVTAGLEALPATYTQVATGIAYPVLPAPNYQQEGGTTFTMDRLDCSWDPLSPCPPKHSYGSLFGSIIYIRAGDRYNYKVGGGTPDGQPILLWAYGASYMTVRDVVTVMAPGNSRFNKIHGYAFTRYPQNGPESYPHSRNLYPVVNNVATRVTSIRGSLGDIQDPDWSVSGVSAGSCLPGTPNCAVQSPWQNTSTNGARICYRTENGQVTNVPLWPWPMNDRIKAATAQAGAYSGPCSINCTWPGGVRPIRGVVDVTADMEALLGPIAAECRSDVVTPPPTSVEPIVEYLNR